jgi:hypothetical protein
MRAVTAIVALPLALAACSGGSAASTHSSASTTTSTTSQTGPSQADYAAARKVASTYLHDLAFRRTTAAARLAAPPGAPAAASLVSLRRFLARLPIARLGMTEQPLASLDGKNQTGVLVTLNAQLDAHTPTAWIALGQRALVMNLQSGAWKVSQDISGRPSVGRQVTGLALFVQPHLLAGTSATVIYGPTVEGPLARTILAAADAAAPELAARYSGGPAARRPVIFLVADRSQGEKLAGRTIDSSVTPLGTQSSSFVYIFLRQYRQADVEIQRSSVVYLETLLATRSLLQRGPQSLWAGVAAYEEDADLRSRHFLLPLDGIQSAYGRGYPTLARWTSTATDWGQSGNAAELASQDALAIVHEIIAAHGGTAAVRRLGQRFAALRQPPGLPFTASQVQAAFQRALGVSFATVLGEARAYVAGGSWRYG